MASLFNIKRFWQRCKTQKSIVQLARIFQNNFCAIVIIFYLAFDFYNLPRELADVANLLQIMLEHHHRESTKPLIFTEIQIAESLLASLNANHFAGDALSFIQMISCLVEGNACG